jgi:CRP/FNR family transcriptional regulator, cyclic AMP receptor protein
MSTKADPRGELLGGTSLFRSCTSKELAEIASLTTDIDVKEGDVLCREGDFGLEFFVIIEGQAAVTIDAEEIATLGPGGFFGEMALLDGGSRIATVTATTPMRLLVLSRREFRGALHASPMVAERMLEVIGARLRSVEHALYGARPPIGI